MSRESQSQYALMELSTPLETLFTTKWPKKHPKQINPRDWEFSDSGAESETPSEFSLKSDSSLSDTSDGLPRCV
jgi:hypothetical protein